MLRRLDIIVYTVFVSALSSMVEQRAYISPVLGSSPGGRIYKYFKAEI